MAGSSGSPLAFLGEVPEAVIPLHALHEGGREGITVTQVFAPQVGVPEAVRREIFNLMPAIRANALEAVLAARERGGPAARKIGGR